MQCRNPSCGREIVQGQYVAEGEAAYAERLATGYCRKKCQREDKAAAPVRASRPLPSLSVVSWNHERGEGVAQPKELPERDAARLAFARSMPCVCCGSIEAVHAHHEAEIGHGTLAGKPSDRRTVPLCGAKCHPLRHSQGRSFWGKIDVEKVIAEINEAYDKRNRHSNF